MQEEENKENSNWNMFWDKKWYNLFIFYIVSEGKFCPWIGLLFILRHHKAQSAAKSCTELWELPLETNNKEMGFVFVWPCHRH